MSKHSEIKRAVRQQIASRSRQLRSDQELTQESLANRAGLALRHLQKIEAAQVNLTIETLAKIAAALEVDPKELMTGDKGEPSK